MHLLTGALLALAQCAAYSYAMSCEQTFPGQRLSRRRSNQQANYKKRCQEEEKSDEACDRLRYLYPAAVVVPVAERVNFFFRGLVRSSTYIFPNERRGRASRATVYPTININPSNIHATARPFASSKLLQRLPIAAAPRKPFLLQRRQLSSRQSIRQQSRGFRSAPIVKVSDASMHILPEAFRALQRCLLRIKSGYFVQTTSCKLGRRPAGDVSRSGASEDVTPWRATAVRFRKLGRPVSRRGRFNSCDGDNMRVICPTCQMSCRAPASPNRALFKPLNRWRRGSLHGRRRSPNGWRRTCHSGRLSLGCGAGLCCMPCAGSR